MRRRFDHGFTLIELMVTIAILALLVVLGVPSYKQWILNTHIRSAAESIQNGLQLARSEAVRRDANVRFDLTSATAADWTVCQLPPGVAVTANCKTANAVSIQSFVSAGGSGGVTLGATAATASITPPTASYGTAISGGVPGGITFNALGRPTDYGGTSIVRVDATSSQTGAHRLVTTITVGGQVRMCDPQVPLSTSPQGCS